MEVNVRINICTSLFLEISFCCLFTLEKCGCVFPVNDNVVCPFAWPKVIIVELHLVG